MRMSELDESEESRKFRALLSTSIFSAISTKELKQVARVAREESLVVDQILFEEGDIGDSLYIIVSGQFKVFRTNSDGVETVLTHQGPGDCIGEMALLTGEPRAASVKASQDSVVLVIPKADFDQLLASTPSLAQTFIRVIANHVRKADLKIEQQAAQELALREFLAQQHQFSEPMLVGKSRPMMTLRKEIEKAAAADQPVVIFGETGAEHVIVAQLIQERSTRKEQVLLIVDCGDIPSLIPLSESQETQERVFVMEISQDSALFGHSKGAFPFAKTRRIGYLEAAHSGTLILKNVDKLKPGVQEKLAAYLRDGSIPFGGGEDTLRVDARIIATSCVDLAESVKSGYFNKDLWESLSVQSVSVPPLRDRKKDLGALCQHFIEIYNEKNGKRVKGITHEAMNLIMSYHWPGNVEELEVVIRRGVNIAQDEMLTSQEIFVGLRPLEGESRFNLFRFSKLRRLFQSQAFPHLLQLATVVFLTLVLLVGLLGPQEEDKNVALILTWAVWWPVLVLSFLFVARFWCGICPITTIATKINSIYNLGLKVPSFLRKYGAYLSVMGFALIIWIEQATNMSHSPLATSFLLLGILAAAIVMGLLFERRAWCRYLCPLGGMASVFSTTSLVELRGNPEICTNECKTHACYVGSDEVSGCPMYQGAFALQSNEHCVLCGNCIKLCENQSPRVNIRPPAIELATNLQQLENKSTGTYLGLALFVPVLIGSLLMRELEGSASQTLPGRVLGTGPFASLITLIGFSALAFSAFWLAGAAITRDRHRFVQGFSLLALVFIPLTFAGELAHQLKHMLIWAGQFVPTLGREIGYDRMQSLGFQMQPAMVYVFQVLAIFSGVLVTLAVGRKVVPNMDGKQGSAPQWVVRALVLMLGIVYLLLFAQSA